MLTARKVQRTKHVQANKTSFTGLRIFNKNGDQLDISVEDAQEVEIDI